MNLLQDKGGFLEPEILYSPGFVILVLFGWSATIGGWMWSRSSDMPAFSIANLLIILVVELVACYFFAAKMFD